MWPSPKRGIYTVASATKVRREWKVLQWETGSGRKPRAALRVGTWRITVGGCARRRGGRGLQTEGERAELQADGTLRSQCGTEEGPSC